MSPWLYTFTLDKHKIVYINKGPLLI
jgi:hypothetical protein